MKLEKETIQSERGMSLIEVMVSLTILGVVLVVLGQGIAFGIRMNTESKTKVSSLGISKRITENLKSQLQSTPAAFDGSTNAASSYYAQFNRSTNNPVLFDADGEEIPANGNKAAALFQATTSVEAWRDSAGNPLTDTSGNVLLKVLNVRVAPYPGNMLPANQNSSASSRETTMKVETTRPAA